MKVRINITAEDIAAGARQSTTHCPVAMACRRAGLEDPSVGHCSFEFSRDNKGSFDEWRGWRGWRLLPDHVIRFISAYDEGKKVTPISFEIEVLDQ